MKVLEKNCYKLKPMKITAIKVLKISLLEKTRTSEKKGMQGETNQLSWIRRCQKQLCKDLN